MCHGLVLHFWVKGYRHIHIYDLQPCKLGMSDFRFENLADHEWSGALGCEKQVIMVVGCCVLESLKGWLQGYHVSAIENGHAALPTSLLESQIAREAM